jgi:hypothetical protein
MSSYQIYGSQPSNIPVTPVDYLEQMAPSPYHENYSARHSPMQRPQQRPVMYERYNGAMNMAPANMAALSDVSIPSTDAAAVKELQQIKYILIGVAVLILLLLILRR